VLYDRRGALPVVCAPAIAGTAAKAMRVSVLCFIVILLTDLAWWAVGP
jgi:predicted transcriptional regulator